jgi:hypothetical protein
LGRIEIKEKEEGIFALVGHPAANIALAAGDPLLTVVAGACTQSWVCIVPRQVAGSIPSPQNYHSSAPSKCERIRHM